MVNGISMLIFAGLVAAIPNVANQIYLQQFQNAGDQLFMYIIKMVLIGLIILAIVVGVIYIQQAVRKIPIQYAKAVSGNNQYQETNTHLPLRVNSAGVIPVIFASTFLMTPRTIAQLFPDSSVSKMVGLQTLISLIQWNDTLCRSYRCFHILLCIYSSKS